MLLPSWHGRVGACMCRQCPMPGCWDVEPVRVASSAPLVVSGVWGLIFAAIDWNRYTAEFGNFLHTDGVDCTASPLAPLRTRQHHVSHPSGM
jgi:hypothetical protein